MSVPAPSQSKLKRKNTLWTCRLSTFPLWLHNCSLVGNLAKKGDAFISTGSKARTISTNYMQICHRHKSTAVHGLTFLFVTSKHSSVPLLSLVFGPVDKCLSYRKEQSTSLISFHLFPSSLLIKRCNVFGCSHMSLSNLDLLQSGHKINWNLFLVFRCAYDTSFI